MPDPGEPGLDKACLFHPIPHSAPQGHPRTEKHGYQPHEAAYRTTAQANQDPFGTLSYSAVGKVRLMLQKSVKYNRVLRKVFEGIRGNLPPGKAGKHHAGSLDHTAQFLSQMAAKCQETMKGEQSSFL